MTMATPRGVVAANLYNMLPRGLQSSNFAATYAARTAAVSWSSFLPSASITIPAITLNIPGIISEIWEGILRAVPKKKTSHMKKRHRQLAGKALKDVTSLVRCPACGKPKKAHTLCPYCVAEIKASWRGAIPRSRQVSRAPPKQTGNVEDREAEDKGAGIEEFENEHFENEELQDSKEKKQTDIQTEETRQNKRQIQTYDQDLPKPLGPHTSGNAETWKVECGHCGKTISQRNMTRHQRLLHPETFDQYKLEQARPFKARPKADQRAQIQQARIPGRKSGGWRSELKFL